MSFAKYETISETVGVSRRTVIRAVKTLEYLGFLKKIPTARMNGKQGVNLYVIQPFETMDSFLQPMSLLDGTAPVTPNKAENKQSSLCEKKQSRTIEKKVSQPKCHTVTDHRPLLMKEESSLNIHTTTPLNENIQTNERHIHKTARSLTKNHQVNDTINKTTDWETIRHELSTRLCKQRFFSNCTALFSCRQRT
ncbi:helix-turn-helix domain-containing protein [Niallia sp. Krafla_26]|uniref:helix-turn-helix domain-containing protein n=1 Tax=Niallia sp. Krafla_26 TaxID=3064703 RepID=UPI003D17285A